MLCFVCLPPSNRQGFNMIQPSQLSLQKNPAIPSGCHQTLPQSSHHVERSGRLSTLPVTSPSNAHAESLHHSQAGEFFAATAKFGQLEKRWSKKCQRTQKKPDKIQQNSHEITQKLASMFIVMLKEISKKHLLRGQILTKTSSCARWWNKVAGLLQKFLSCFYEELILRSC